MFATVTIQTYNHAKTLAKTLESLRTLRCPNGSDYEILVVNNNSSDDTADVIKRYAKILAPRLCSIFESRQGLSHARNRALKEAKGEIVCFTDDDVRVDPEWLIAITEAFEKYDASIVGGRSYIIFPEGMQKPEWLTERFEKLWSRLDYGDEVLVGTDKDLYGLNFSVLKEAALKVGGFDPNLGRNGKHLISGEEKDL
ncbi:MAG: glycosyltransferase family 2 protein, partial [Desulfobacteraceae bacterium]|nr:glycosyltransferase family 2 protein [Desulfobacteraceae bacterium]